MTAATMKMFGVIVDREPVVKAALADGGQGYIHRVVDRSAVPAGYGEVLGVHVGTQYAVVRYPAGGSGSTQFAATLEGAQALLSED